MEKFNHLEDHLGYWMRFVSNHVSSSFSKKLEGYEVGVAEWVVLRHLYDHQTLSPGILAKMTGMTRGAISKLMDRLVDKKLVARIESANDRRFQDIKLSEKGKKLLPKLVAVADANDDQFFGHLSKAQKDHFIDVLKEIVRASQLNNKPIN